MLTIGSWKTTVIRLPCADGQGGDGLAAAGFSHQAADLAVLHPEAHAPDGVLAFRRGEEMDAQVFDF